MADRLSDTEKMHSIPLCLLFQLQCPSLRKNPNMASNNAVTASSECSLTASLIWSHMTL